MSISIVKKCLIGCLLAISCVPVYGLVHITYSADDVTVFPNPERGFTDELNRKVSDSKPGILADEQDYFDEEGERESQRLVALFYNLGNYKSKDLSDKVLNGFDQDMQILRDKGFKCVLRFCYTESDNKDATLDWVKRHITQLQPHLAANADVIYVLEAGFVGEWGEWYYSKNFGNETQQLNANRKAVLEALIDAIPSELFLLVRYPLIKMQYLGDERALTAEEAFGSSARAKIGHHNDALLNTYGNDGTYGRDGEGPDDDPVLRQYIADETLYVPNGGETNVEKSSVAEQVYAKAPDEMSRYHWSFCGAEYSEKVTNRWRNSGIFDELNRKMGYRFQLVSADMPASVPQGAETVISITLKNVGYAPLYNARPVYLVLREGEFSYPIRLQTDPRKWLPNGETSIIQETITIPASIPASTYDLYLHMPDAHASIAADPRFAVRFANTDVWDAATGMNNLHTQLRVENGNGLLMENTRPAPQPIKIIQNGQIYIQKGTKIYTITGIEINNFEQ